jgi:hypothetical protein
MKIAFLLGSPDISGGTYVIFEHAIRSKKYGYDVSIITSEKIDQNRLNWHPESKILTWLTYDETENIKFDIVIATWWKTIFSLHQVASKSYMYFVQSIESKFYPEYEVALRRLVESTYSLELPVITEATWIKEYIENTYPSEVFLAYNGIRKDIYNLKVKPLQEREKGKLRVLVEGPLGISFKNVEKTIELCLKSDADEVWLLTSSEITSYKGVTRVFSKIPINETAKIYSSCDVLVKLSYVEGMFGPPLEIFHCGGTAIVYDVTGHDEYIAHGKNGIVVERDNEQEVIKYLNTLKKDSLFLADLKRGAIETANNWIDWGTSSAVFRSNVESIFKKYSDTPQRIKKLTDFHMINYIEFEDFIKKNYKLAIIKSMHNIKEKIKFKYPKIFSLIKKTL